MSTAAESAPPGAVEEWPYERFGVLDLIRSDYRRFREVRGRSIGREQAGRGGMAAAVIKHITNTQLRATVLMRLSCAAPRWLQWFFRSVLMYLHSSEIGYGARIGPEFRVPHPSGIVIGGQVVIGRNVAIAQNVTLGSDLQVSGQPTIEDDVIILTGAVVAGPVTIGRGAMIGANSVVMEDIPPGGICAPARLRVVRGRGANWALRRRGIEDW